MVLLAVVMPVVLFVVFVVTGRTPRPAVLGVAVVLTVLDALAMASIGIFFLPVVALAWVAVYKTSTISVH